MGLAILLTMAVFVGAGEILFRSIKLNPQFSAWVRLERDFLASTQIHPTWGWSFVPRADTIWDYTGMERQPIRIKFKTAPIPGYPQYGMRDERVPSKRDVMIPVFGDSFTFGATVSREDIWCELIESRNRPNVEMLNLANGGGLTKAVAQYSVLRDVLPDHRYVIYQMWLGNEFLDNYAFPISQVHSSSERRKYWLKTWWYKIKADSYLLLAMNDAVNGFLKLARLSKKRDNLGYVPEDKGAWDPAYGRFIIYPKNAILTRYLETPYFDESIEKGIENTKRAILDMKRLVGDQKVLVIFLFPFKEQLYEITKRHRENLTYRKPNDIILHFCKENNVACYDLFDSLTQHKQEKLFWDYDPHFTPRGQYWASVEVEDILRKTRILQGH